MAHATRRHATLVLGEPGHLILINPIAVSRCVAASRSRCRGDLAWA